MKKKMFKSSVLLALTALMLFSCNKNDDNQVNTNPPITENQEFDQGESWVIFNGNANWDGGIYNVDEKRAKELNLAQHPFYQVSYSAGGRLENNTLYKLNGAIASEIGIAKFTINGSQIAQEGFVSTPNNSYETNYLIVDPSEGYYWDLGAGGMKIQKFNPTTMQRTGEIDFSSLSNGSPYEAAGQLILAKRDNKLFVDIQNGTRTAAWQVQPDENKVRIAVYNLSNNSIENVTEYENTTHLGLFADHVLWSLDEITKDLYIVSVGDMRSQSPASKILRIKNGENSFDTNFEINIQDYQFPSEFNRILAHNNKIYTTISSRPTSYYGGGQHGVSYRQDIWYWTEIDVQSKKAKRINNIPADNYYAYQNPFVHKGEIYFVSNNNTENYAGVNQYNPETGVVKETFHLKESGRLMGFHILKK